MSPTADPHRRVEVRAIIRRKQARDANPIAEEECMRDKMLVVSSALLLVALWAGPARAQEEAAGTPDAAALFKSQCAACHGEAGVPTPMGKMLKAPDLSAPERADISTDSIATVISQGKGQMKGFADRLSEAEIKALAEYVQGLVKKPEKKN